MAITQNQFQTLNDLFDYYNGALFANELPECLVNMSRHRGAHGFFAPERWKSKSANADEKRVHEISLNPDTMNRTDREWHSTLVHEMCHLWQQELGTPPRRCYHDKQFAAKMEAIGLMPSHNGQPGGKRTGQSMTHYIIDGAAFDTAFAAIDTEALERLKLPYVPARPRINLSAIVAVLGGDDEKNGSEAPRASEPVSKSGVKHKYSCSCGHNVWGKPGLKITCDECEEAYDEQE